MKNHKQSPSESVAVSAEARSLTERLQLQCSEWGTYWRASDAHGVQLTNAQAIELLQTALGVEVEIVAALSAPQEAGKPERCTHCDDTGDVHSIDGEWRGFCSCTAGIAAMNKPSKHGEWVKLSASKEASKGEPVAWPTVDELAQQIRWLGGSSGAGRLAEGLLEWLKPRVHPTQQALSVLVDSFRRRAIIPQSRMSELAQGRISAFEAAADELAAILAAAGGERNA